MATSPRTRRLGTLLAVLALTAGVLASSARPAAAYHSDDHAEAWFSGVLNFDFDDDDRTRADGDFDGDVECEIDGDNPPGDVDDRRIPTCDDDPDELCWVGNRRGDRVELEHGRAAGVFTASRNATGGPGIGAVGGTAGFATIFLCVVDDVTTHDLNGDGLNDRDNDGNGTNDLFDRNGDGNADVAPAVFSAHGGVEPVNFVLSHGVNLLSPGGSEICLYGSVSSGTFTQTGRVMHVALHAQWTLKGEWPWCDSGSPFIAQTNPEVELHGEWTVEAVTVDGTLRTRPPDNALEASTTDMSGCTREVLVDPFFEILRSDFGPEPSVCLLLKWPVERSFRLTLRAVH